MSYNSLRKEVYDGLDVEEGFRIPVANEKNKKLENKYLQLQRHVAHLNSELNEQNDRLTNMTNHFKNVNSEVESCQTLLAAKNKELETEKHLGQVQQREVQNMKTNMAKLKKQLDDMKERKHTFQNSIFVASERLEAKRMEAQLDKKQLEELLEKCRVKNEDEMVLEKYSRQDETKIRDLSVKIATLTQECLNYRRKIDYEDIELKTAKYGLEKTAEEYRARHRERQRLIERWTETLAEMQRSDMEIDELSIKITKAKRRIEEQEQEVKEERDRLEREKASNGWLEEKVHYLEGMQVKLKQVLLEMNEVKETVKSEHKALKNVLDKTASQLESNRSELKQLKKKAADTKEKIEQSKRQMEELKRQRKEQDEGNMTAEAEAKQLEEKLNRQEKIQRKLEEEMRVLGEAMVKKHNHVAQLNDQGKRAEMLINGGRARLGNMESLLKQLEEEAQKQKKAIYNNDYTLQALQKKLDNMTGKSVSSEEKEKYEKEIAEMEELLEEKRKKLHGMKVQRNLLNEEVGRQRGDLKRGKEIKVSLEKQVGELELKIEVTMKALKTVFNEKEEKLVEENLKKLEVKRLHDRLMKQADEEVGREKEFAMLTAVVQERETEIDIVRKQVVSRIRLMEEDLRKTNMLLQDSTNQGNCLKNRYEVVMMKMTNYNEDDNSLVSYIVKTAYETEELKARGDQLYKELQATEAELEALDNTVALLEGNNQAQKGALKRASSKVNDAEKVELGGKLGVIGQEVKELKKTASILYAKNHSLMAALNELVNKKTYLDMAVSEKKIMMSKVNKEMNDQKLRLSRIQTLNLKLLKETEKIRKTHPELAEDVRLKELKWLNRMADSEIVNTAARNPHLASTLQHKLKEAGVSLLSKPETSPAAKVVSRSPSLLSLRSSANSPTKLTRATSRISTVLISLDNAADSCKSGVSGGRVSGGSGGRVSGGSAGRVSGGSGGRVSTQSHSSFQSRQNSSNALQRTLSRSTINSSTSIKRKVLA